MSLSQIAPATNAGLDLRLRLKVRAYRAFRDEAALELRPLTLLYGRNQTGKSSLLRLVPLISDSLRPGASALDLQSAALRGATFKELGHLGRQPDLSPRLTIVASTQSPEPTLALTYVDEGGMLVNKVRLFRGDGRRIMFDVSYDSDARRESNRQSASYAGSYRGGDWNGPLTFQRLLPDGLPPEAAEIAGEVDHALEPLRRVQWLQPNRFTDGDALASKLGGPSYKAALDRTAAWLREQGICDEIAVRPDSDGRPRFVLGFSGREHLPLHLAGEGVRSVLPVVLHASLAELGMSTADIDAPTLLAIEELETNLHPDLQVALFRRLLGTVRAGVPLLLETHSVYVLRAMQIAVLRSEIAPEQVGLHWIEQRDGAASVTFIPVNKDAELSGWRPAVFEQEQELAHEILDLRWKRAEAR